MAAHSDARPLDALGAAQAEGMHLLGASPPDTGRAKNRAAYLLRLLVARSGASARERPEGLAHPCGYGARPPFSQERLSELPDGRLAYRLKGRSPRVHGTFQARRTSLRCPLIEEKFAAPLRRKRQPRRPKKAHDP